MSVLVDTSVWVDHLRGNEPHLVELLKAGNVHVHGLVIGELACGNLDNRDKRLGDWHALPRTIEPTNEQVLRYIEARRLMGCGIGFVDAHLLYTVETSDGLKLWTRDSRLRSIAERHGTAHEEPGKEKGSG